MTFSRIRRTIVVALAVLPLTQEIIGANSFATSISEISEESAMQLAIGLMARHGVAPSACEATAEKFSKPIELKMRLNEKQKAELRKMLSQKTYWLVRIKVDKKWGTWIFIDAKTGNEIPFPYLEKHEINGINGVTH
jgi:hypothetical protein